MTIFKKKVSFSTFNNIKCRKKAFAYFNLYSFAAKNADFLCLKNTSETKTNTHANGCFLFAEIFGPITYGLRRLFRMMQDRQPTAEVLRNSFFIREVCQACRLRGIVLWASETGRKHLLQQTR